MAFAGSDLGPDTDFSPNGRFALAFSHLAVHTDNRPDSHALAAGDPHDYVKDILDESAQQWKALLDYPFPYDLAKGATPLNGFRHYMIQDATHFEYFYRVRMEALGRTGTFDELKDFARILSSPGLSGVEASRDDCTTKLGVPKEVVNTEPVSSELKTFIDFVAAIANKTGNDYLDLIIALLPGILAYDIICKKLVRDPETVRNTVFYTIVIEPWSKIPAIKHKKYINSHIAGLTQEERDKRWPEWVANFKKGCENEILFSSLASPGDFPAYNIVADGIYNIRSYHKGNPYLVSSVPASVTTQAATPKVEGVWRLTNSPNGYNIQNVRERGFLASAVKEPLEPTFGVSIVPQDYAWSILPITVKGSDGKPLTVYQFLVPGWLQYALDAGNNPGDRKVYVSNNAQISSQFWVLTPLELTK